MVRNHNACHGTRCKNQLVVSVQSGPLFRRPDVARVRCYHEPPQARHALAAMEELILPHFLSSAALAHEGQVFPLLGERVQRVEVGKWAKAAGVLWARRQTPRRHPVTRPRGLTSPANRCLGSPSGLGVVGPNHNNSLFPGKAALGHQCWSAHVAGGGFSSKQPQLPLSVLRFTTESNLIGCSTGTKTTSPSSQRDNGLPSRKA